MVMTVTNPDPRLDAALRYATAIGALLVMLVPAARGMHPALGWLPLWLVAMPGVAWWALRGFALPGWGRRAQAPARLAAPAPRRLRQARRVARPRRRSGMQPRAA
jgi:hypothetical protein